MISDLIQLKADLNKVKMSYGTFLKMKAGEKQPNSKLTLRKILQGTALILISNLVYIGNNYIVAWTELKAPEIALVRGCFQVIIFGVIVWRGWRAKAVETIDQGISR